MTEDHLDKGLGLSLSWSQSGISLSTNSRFMNAVDRWLGVKIYKHAIYDEASISITKAKTDAELGLIKASADIAFREFSSNPDQAERAMLSHTRRILSSQQNKEAVLLEAKRDLEENPPLEDKDGEVSEETLDMFENHAEQATSQQLREMFGKLFAEEMRAPGAVSEATLHFVKLLDREVASLIERVAPYCIGKTCMVSAMQVPLSYAEDIVLQQAGFWSGNSSLTLKPSPDGQLDEGIIFGPNFKLVRAFLGGREINLTVKLLSKAANPLVLALNENMKWDDIAELCIRNGSKSVHITDGVPPKSGSFGNLLYIPDADNKNYFTGIEIVPSTGAPCLETARKIKIRKP